jgi:hypothetical protein
MRLKGVLEMVKVFELFKPPTLSVYRDDSGINKIPVAEFNITVRVEARDGRKTIIVPMDDGSELSLSPANALRIYEAVRREELMSRIDILLEENFSNDDGTYDLGEDRTKVSIPDKNRTVLIEAAAKSYIEALDESEEKWLEARTQDCLRSAYDDLSDK